MVVQVNSHHRLEESTQKNAVWRDDQGVQARVPEWQVSVTLGLEDTET